MSQFLLFMIKISLSYPENTNSISHILTQWLVHLGREEILQKFIVWAIEPTRPWQAIGIQVSFSVITPAGDIFTP